MPRFLISEEGIGHPHLPWVSHCQVFHPTWIVKQVEIQRLDIIQPRIVDLFGIIALKKHNAMPYLAGHQILTLDRSISVWKLSGLQIPAKNDKFEKFWGSRHHAYHLVVIYVIDCSQVDIHINQSRGRRIWIKDCFKKKKKYNLSVVLVFAEIGLTELFKWKCINDYSSGFCSPPLNNSKFPIQYQRLSTPTPLIWSLDKAQHTSMIFQLILKD